MKKIDDWFCAGLIAGVIGGIALNLYCLILILFGVPTGTYWEAMGGLFYNKHLLKSWLAQVHGVIDSTGVSGANGILTCLIIKLTGTKYFYVKSVVLSAIGGYFLFLSVYPQTGLSKDNPYTPWVALSGHMIFLGLLTGYILKKIYPFDTKTNQIESDTINKPSSIKIKPGNKTQIKNVISEELKKPKKISNHKDKG